MLSSQEENLEKNTFSFNEPIKCFLSCKMLWQPFVNNAMAAPCLFTVPIFSLCTCEGPQSTRPPQWVAAACYNGLLLTWVMNLCHIFTHPANTPVQIWCFQQPLTYQKQNTMSVLWHLFIQNHADPPADLRVLDQPVNSAAKSYSKSYKGPLQYISLSDVYCHSPPPSIKVSAQCPKNRTLK